jgi:hypothetical protein
VEPLAFIRAGLDDLIGRMPRNLEGTADQETAGAHLATRLAPELRHRHGRQEREHDVVLPEIVLPEIAALHPDVAGAGHAEAELRDPGRERRDLDPEEAAVRSLAGEVVEQAA